MTRDEIAALATRHIQLMGAGDASGLSKLYAPAAVVESPMFGTLNGRDAVERAFTALFKAFPDWHGEIDTLVIDADRAVIVVKIVATQVQEFFGVPPTGKGFQINTALVWHLDGALIARERRIYDFTGLLLQTGVLKARPA